MKLVLYLFAFFFMNYSISQIFQIDDVNGQTITACGGVFTDDGGLNGDYGNNDNYQVTFCSGSAGAIQFDFTSNSWDLNGGDHLWIYDGAVSGVNLIYSSQAMNEVNPGVVIANSGCITFVWDSNLLGNTTGWGAAISCLCFDGIQNGSETGIDCGGSCPTICPAQCNVVITANPSTGILCTGDAVTLEAAGVASAVNIFSNDFDNGLGSGWTSNINADFSNPCDPSFDGGSYMWMGNSAPHPRIIQSESWDVSCGGELCFWLDFSSQSQASPCEGIDIANEGVYLDYSIDGINWINIEYFGPAGVGNSTSNGGSDPFMTSWNYYCFDIPPGAYSINTSFRWAQTGSSGLNNDHWGIDNVVINAVPCDDYVYDWSHIVGSDDNPIIIENISQTTTYDVVYTNNSNDICSTSITIVVTDSPVAYAGIDILGCAGDIVTIGGTPSASGGDGNYQYNWSPSLNLSSSNTSNPDLQITTSGAYSLLVTDGNGCTDISTFNLTVNPVPNVYQVSNIVLCHNEIFNQLSFFGDLSSTDYSWSVNNNAIGIPTSGVNDILSFQAVNTTYFPITTTVTVIPTHANGCLGEAMVFDIIVNPLPNVNTVSDQYLCADETFGVINFGGQYPTAVYDWTNNNVSTGLNLFGQNSIQSFTGLNFSTIDLTSTITVVPSLNGCLGSPMVFEIIIHPTPTIDLIFDQTLCAGESTSDVVFTGNVPNTTFNWTNSETSIGLIGSGTGDINSFVSLNTSTAIVNALIEVLPTANSCQGDITSFNIEVNPIPTVDPMIDVDYCTDEITSQVTFTGSVPNTNFSWTNSETSIGLAASGSSNIMDFTTTNLTSVDLNAIISVTPLLNGCEGPTDDFTFTIHPDPTVAAISDQELCADEITQVILFSGSVASTTFTWMNSNTDIGLVGFGSGDINSFNAQNATGIPTQGVVEVTPSANGCFGSSEDFTITVNPLPIASIYGSITLCENDANPALLIEGLYGVAPYTIGYTLNNGPTQFITTMGSSVSITVPTNVPGTFTYTIVSIEDNSSTHCNNAQNEIAIVVVNPLPVINAGVDITLCEFDQVILTASGAGAQGYYVWTPLVTDGLSFEPSVGTQTYSVVGTDINGCQNTDDLDITVIPTPVVSFSASELSACEELTTTFLNSSIGNLDNCIWTLSNGDTHQGCTDWISSITDIGCFDVTLEVSTVEGCTNSATYQDYICVYESPVAGFTPTPETLYVYVWESVMENESTGASSYIWDFGDFSQNSTAINPTHEFPNNQAGTYEIQLIAISNQNCVDTAYQTVILIDELLFFVPNTFTPDDNELNQVFTPVFTTGYDPQKYEMLIFNRWGELIFETHDVNVGWGGTYGKNTAKCSDGTYTWVINVRNTAEKIMEQFTGNVNLIK